MMARLKETLIGHVEKTFQSMFGVDIHSAGDLFSDFNDDDMVTKVVLHQDGLIITMRFVFQRPLLKPLLAKVYPPALAGHEMAYEDAACEIANIVCNGIKAFLNENGYKLTMDFPKIDYQNVSPSAPSKQDHLSLYFVLHKEGLYVDLFMDEQDDKNHSALI